MLMFVGTLLKVELGEFNSLVFASNRYDFGLGMEVPCSQNITMFEDTVQFAANYKSMIGEKVALPIRALKTKKGSIMLVAAGDVLDVTELLTA